MKQGLPHPSGSILFNIHLNRVHSCLEKALKKKLMHWTLSNTANFMQSNEKPRHRTHADHAKFRLEIPQKLMAADVMIAKRIRWGTYSM
jgi:hypothetical protein